MRRIESGRRRLHREGSGATEVDAAAAGELAGAGTHAEARDVEPAIRDRGGETQAESAGDRAIGDVAVDALPLRVEVGYDRTGKRVATSGA